VLAKPPLAPGVEKSDALKSLFPGGWEVGASEAASVPQRLRLHGGSPWPSSSSTLHLAPFPSPVPRCAVEAAALPWPVFKHWIFWQAGLHPSLTCDLWEMSNARTKSLVWERSEAFK